MSAKLKYTDAPFSKIRVLYYEKSEPFIIRFKTSISDINYTTSEIIKQPTRKVLGTPSDLFTSKLTIYQQKSIISNEKRNDIKDLLPCRPTVDKEYFKAMLKI